MDKEKLQRGLGLFLDAMRPYVVSVVEPYSRWDRYLGMTAAMTQVSAPAIGLCYFLFHIVIIRIFFVYLPPNA